MISRSYVYWAVKKLSQISMKKKQFSTVSRMTNFEDSPELKASMYGAFTQDIRTKLCKRVNPKWLTQSFRGPTKT